MSRKQVGAIDSALLDRVDAARGDVPRTKFVERALEEALGGTHPARGVGNSPLVEPASGPASPRAPEMTPVREMVDEAAGVKEARLATLREQMANVSGESMETFGPEEEPAPVCEACGIDTVERQLPSGERVWVCPDCHGKVKR